MCGICGFLVRGEGFPAAELEPTVSRMADTLRHRGPDSSGSWVDAGAGIALGHRRLAIVDLTPDGAQPMVSACGRYVIAFNGEIYNFRELRKELEGEGVRFRGRSDTEVLLEAIARWGTPQALSRANWMLAFAVWDRRERVLTLARDRLGEKPLYWGRFGGTILFGAELKALRALPRFRAEIDRGALAHLVQYSYVPAPASIFLEVRKVEAGTWLEIPAEPLAPLPAPNVFWSAAEVAERGAAARFTGDEVVAEEALHELLADAVERRMISDVPLGGVRNVGEAFLPPQLAYLASYFRQRAMNPLLPLSLALSAVATAVVWQAALADATAAHAAPALALLGSLLALGLLEHVFLALPLPTHRLWQWSLRSRPTTLAAVEPSRRDALAPNSEPCPQKDSRTQHLPALSP